MRVVSLAKGRDVLLSKKPNEENMSNSMASHSVRYETLFLVVRG